MSQSLPPREPVRPAVLSLASRTAALKDATRRLRRWPRGRARPSLTAAIRLARGCSGRDEKTVLQPNQKTGLAVPRRRTTHALQKADIFTRHRHAGQLTHRPVPSAEGMDASTRPAADPAGFGDRGVTPFFLVRRRSTIIESSGKHP